MHYPLPLARRPWAACLLPALAALSWASASSEKQARPEYVIHRADGPLTIDGRLDEPAWFAAPHVGDFMFTWWKSGEKHQTRAKLLWDDENLYVGAVCQDGNIIARDTERDARGIAEADCIEVMLMPNPATPEKYFNVEYNVRGGIVDNFRPNGAGKPRMPKWDAEGVRVGGTLVGTLNDPSDVDRCWIVEVAIPFRNFAEVAGKPHPAPGDVWKLNLNRQNEAPEGDSRVARSSSSSQWSPGDSKIQTFHQPDHFGRVKFSGQSPLAANAVRSP